MTSNDCSLEDVCVVCMELLEASKRYRCETRDVSARSDSDFRICLRAPECRGNAGVCDSCERMLDICVLCRTALPEKPVESKWTNSAASRETCSYTAAVMFATAVWIRMKFVCRQDADVNDQD